jgi:hypothetical protein
MASNVAFPMEWASRLRDQQFQLAMCVIASLTAGEIDGLSANLILSQAGIREKLT